MKIINRIRNNFFISCVFLFLAIFIFFLGLDFLRFLYALVNGKDFYFDFYYVIRKTFSLFAPFFFLDLIYYLGKSKDKRHKHF